MSRAEQTKTERRRRNTDSLSGKRRRLALNVSELDTENFEYRWVNTEPGRIEALTKQDDWEIVTDRDGKLKADNTDVGAGVSIHAGGGATGSPVRAVLVRKLKKYQDEDRAARQRQIDEQEADLKRGNTPGGAQGGAFYQPDGSSIRIENRAKS